MDNVLNIKTKLMLATPKEQLKHQIEGMQSLYGDIVIPTLIAYVKGDVLNLRSYYFAGSILVRQANPTWKQDMYEIQIRNMAQYYGVPLIEQYIEESCTSNGTIEKGVGGIRWVRG